MIYKNMIPLVLKQVCECLKASELLLPSGSGDSRKDSADGEQKIISVLQNTPDKHWNIISPSVGKNRRSWYDVWINGYYCDIKISELRSTDNTNARRAIYYFITGKGENIPGENESYFKNMRDNENEDEDRDYYYIIVNKLDVKDIFVVSLKGIQGLRPAGNNLPFQVNWDNCRRPVHRNWQSAKEYLLKTYAQSLKSRMDSIERGLPKYYPEIWCDNNSPTK